MTDVWIGRIGAVFAALLVAASPAAAQQPQAAARPLMVIAVPPLPTPRNEKTDAGETGVIGIQIAQQIATDLRSSGAAYPMGPDNTRVYTATEAAAPMFDLWRGTGASALVTGYVERRPDGRLMIACYMYDLRSRRELTRKGFAVVPEEWRRAAHRCADAIYEQATGHRGYFDTRIAYVAETGPTSNRVKRIAVMDYDGTDHRFLTAGEVTVLTPRFSPDGRRIAYMSFTGQPHIRILDVGGGGDRPLVQAEAITFAPRFSPDGRRIVFSMASGGNTDIYVVGSEGGFQTRLTSAPGEDTAPSFSPDGRQIVFESNRSGTQQLYVMNADGSDQRRISFGQGAHASPVWSPQGDRIAFARILGGNLRIGVMSSSGSDERMLTDGWQDEGPSWAPNGQLLAFQRTERGTGRTAIYVVPLAGGEPRRIAAPQDGSDPDWWAPRL